MAQHPKVEYIRMYTDGSAARQIEIAAPVPKAKLPRAKKQKKILLYIDPVAICGIMVSVLMLVIMTISAWNLCQLQQQTLALENYVTELRTENASLRGEYEANINLNRVERQALSMGLVPVEEVPHIRIQVPEAPVEEAGFWDGMTTFLTGLFA